MGHTPDAGLKCETRDFVIADEEILNLLRQLAAERVCGCCVARALAIHAAEQAEHSVGTAAAIEMFEGVIRALREGDAPAPDPLSTQAH
jgi:hypothetical protein